MDDEVTLTLPSQRLMIFQDTEWEMPDRVGVLETAVENAVDHGSPPEYAKMLRDIVFRTPLDVLCRPLLGDQPAREKHGAVHFNPGARVLRAKPPPERNRLWWSAPESRLDYRSVTTSSSSRLLEKGRRGRRAPGSRCRACLMLRRPCCEKSPKR